MDEHRQEARDAGCDEYETKPVRLPSLLEKIEQFS
jgi:CheY-like chemotaxis protein